MSEVSQSLQDFPGKSGHCPRPVGSITCPWRLRPVSEVPRGRPAVLDDLRRCPSCQGVHQLSRTTHNPVRGPAVSPAGLDHSLLCLSSRGDDQQSRMTRACIRGAAVSISCPGRLGSGSECPRGRSAVPGDLGPCVTAFSVDQLSWEYQACAGWPAVSISCPGRLVLVVEAPRGRPPALGNSGPGLRVCSVDKHSRVTRALVRCPKESTSPPGRLGPVPEFPRVDQLSWAIQARVRWPAGATGGPGSREPWAAGVDGGPAFIGYLGLGPYGRSPGVDQLSQATRAWALARAPAGSTS